MQAALGPGLDHFAQITGNKRYQLDTVGGDQGLQGPGNRSADQSADAEFDQALRLLQRLIRDQQFLRFADDALGLECDDMDPLRGIEDRRNAFIQVCECYLHDSRLTPY